MEPPSNTRWDHRFGGLSRLYGPVANRLPVACVMVVGLGGVGSWTAEALARSGVGTLILVDPDDVCLTNTNRQIHAVEGAWGQPKALALAARLRSINPGIEVQTEVSWFSERTAEQLLDRGPDVLVDAIDHRRNKCLLIASARERGIRTVTVGGAGGKRDGTAVRVSDLSRARGDELLRLVRKQLRREHGFPQGEGQLFGVLAVYSEERPHFPWSDGSVCAQPEPGQSLRLDCASGFGTAAHVTGAFGLAAAGAALQCVLDPPSPP